jgi:hypothetical protein
VRGHKRAHRHYWALDWQLRSLSRVEGENFLSLGIELWERAPGAQ